MRLLAPKYYLDFKCTAEKCTHSCCIGWEIDIDSNTLAHYLRDKDESIINTIEFDTDSGASHFRLCENGRCPHLTSCGLCKIMIEHGEQYLCDICREHPRFYNVTADCAEVGLGMSCEEACRLILECSDYITMHEVGSIKTEPCAIDFDATTERGKIYSILSDSSIPYTQRIRALWQRYKKSPDRISDEDFKNIISSLEYLDGTHKELFLNYSSTALCPEEYEAYLERALAYFIYRHASSAKTENEFLSSLGFAFFCERLYASLLSSNEITEKYTPTVLAGIISEEIEYSEENTENIIFEFDLL